MSCMAMERRGWNNPAKVAIAEIRNMWPYRPIHILVSIRTGLEEALQLNDTSKEISQIVQSLLQNTSPGHVFKLAVAEYAVKYVTSCELIHRDISEHADRDILEENYFRLNVPQGIVHNQSCRVWQTGRYDRSYQSIHVSWRHEEKETKNCWAIARSTTSKSVLLN